MSQPRICLATDSAEPSGVGEHMLALGDALSRDFAVLFAAPDGSLLRRAARRGLAIRRLDGDGKGWLASSRLDLLHVHAGIGWEGHDLAAAARAAGVPTVFRTEHLPYLITDPEQRDAHAAGLDLVDRVIVVSEDAARSHRRAGLGEERLAVVRNGIDVPRPGRDRAAVRAALGIDEAAPVVLSVARFAPQKNHALLVAAARIALSARPGMRFVLAGAGPLLEAIQAAAADLGPAVIFLGRRDDVPDLLAAADLFVLPSRFEGLPLAVLEAMAAGLPVVATAIGGTSEAVEDGVTGRLVPPNNARALATAMLAVLADPGEARRLGEAGRQRVRDNFGVARMASETAALYRGGGLPAANITPKGNAMDRVRIGFVGVGGIAARHLGVLERFPDAEIVAFADADRDRADEAAGRFGARSHADPRAMFDAGGLDAVFVCVPPFAHGEIERQLVDAGIPFFVEKPLATDLRTAETIAAAVEARGLVTAVGYHWRYLDTIEEAQHLLAGNPAHLVSGYWLDATPPPAWWWRNDQSGGQVVEQTTHIVDLARLLVGEVDEVFGLGAHRPRDDFPGLDVFTASTASLRFASGAVGNIASTCLLRWGHRIGLHLFADGLAIELGERDIMVDTGRGRPVRGAEGDPVEREDRDFLDAVKGGDNRIRSPYAEALKTHRVTCAIAASARSGRPLRPHEVA